jgi:hypothetical protein
MVAKAEDAKPESILADRSGYFTRRGAFDGLGLSEDVPCSNGELRSSGGGCLNDAYSLGQYPDPIDEI